MSHTVIITKKLAAPALAETHDHEAAPAKSVKVWHVITAVFLVGLVIGLAV